MSNEITPACGIKGHTVGGYDGEKHWCVECTEATDKANASKLTTDEMIRALVKTGKFKLPQFLIWSGMGQMWFYCEQGLLGSAARNLCAMKFAQDATHLGWPIGLTANEKIRDKMAVGNADAAIRILWELMQ